MFYWSNWSSSVNIPPVDLQVHPPDVDLEVDTPQSTWVEKSSPKVPKIAKVENSKQLTMDSHCPLQNTVARYAKWQNGMAHMGRRWSSGLKYQKAHRTRFGILLKM